MANRLHQFLRNESQRNDGFKKKRGFAQLEPEEDEEDLPKTISADQKIKLRGANESFSARRNLRRESKTLEIPVSIDLVRIDFFAVFNLDLQKKFLLKYGLSVLEYTNYNKSVLFEITKEAELQQFINHLGEAIASNPGETYENKPYNLISLIYGFEFISDAERQGPLTETGFLISLIHSVNIASVEQKTILLTYLQEQNTSVSYNEAYPDLIEVENLTTAQLATLVKNFDIIKLVSTTRPIKIRPGLLGDVRREYGFEVVVADDLPVVAIIDTGVNAIQPLRDLLSGIRYDHTGTGANWDDNGHGTMVAGLVALGDSFPSAVSASYHAKAKLAVIKVINGDNDSIDIPRLLNDIRDAKRTHNVRLFNMSLTLGITKPYNAAFCSFAFELDKLAFEEDILIIIAVGNYDGIDLENLIAPGHHPSHGYPKFFYDLNSTSQTHKCWYTNLMEPSESLNNISIGALAGNLEGTTGHDATPASEYPAYYTRKFHLDHAQKVNGTQLQKNQKSKSLNKPDLVFEGGDLFEFESGIEVLRSPVAATDPFFTRLPGTSLSTPLVASLAAEILQYYPQLRTQSVKALLINTALSAAGPNPPAFIGLNDLYKKLTGFGRPSRNNLVMTDDNKAVWIVEDLVQFEELKVIPIKIPPFIAAAENKIHVTATLCYSFLPTENNHLNYLPLHISFGFFKNIEAGEMGTSNADEYRIKNSITWSEDFFGIEKRLLSNTQKLNFNLQPNDLVNLDNTISLAIRCTGKKEIPDLNKSYVEDSAHKFSIVIAISEIPERRASGRLYTEINAINHVENIAEADGDIEVQL